MAPAKRHTETQPATGQEINIGRSPNPSHSDRISK
jgi:hypothetical protein